LRTLALVMGLIAGAAAPLQAECMGACQDALAAALVSIAVYGLIGIAVLVMLIRAKWRRVGLRTLTVVTILAVGVPLLSQGWLAVRTLMMQRHEVVGAPPALSDRTPLLITNDWTCEYGACGAVLMGRGAAGVYALPPEALSEIDLSSGPVPLAELPLEFWAAGDGGQMRKRQLTPDQRRRAAGEIDYLVYTAASTYLAGPGPVDAALRLNRTPQLGGGAKVQMLLAPLDPASGVLAIAELRPDLLDLSLTTRALAIPLAPYNTQTANDGPVSLDVLVQAVCPGQSGQPDLICRDLLDR
jgi:hypothetical protein